MAGRNGVISRSYNSYSKPSHVWSSSCPHASVKLYSGNITNCMVWSSSYQRSKENEATQLSCQVTPLAVNLLYISTSAFCMVRLQRGLPRAMPVAWTNADNPSIGILWISLSLSAKPKKDSRKVASFLFRSYVPHNEHFIALWKVIMAFLPGSFLTCFSNGLAEFQHN